jgi:hypothetical protein
MRQYLIKTHKTSGSWPSAGAKSAGRKKEEERRKREEGRGKKEEGRCNTSNRLVESCFIMRKDSNKLVCLDKNTFLGT